MKNIRKFYISQFSIRKLDQYELSSLQIADGYLTKAVQ